MHTTEKGSVALSVGDRQLVLHDVLLSETAHLGAGPVHEPQVLVGVRKFARDTGLGLSFPADGKSMHVYDGNECIAAAETDDDALYVIRRQDLASGNDKTASISVVLSAPGPGEHAKSMLQKGKCEATSVNVVFSAPSESKNTEIMGTTARVYPTTDRERTRSYSQENASSPPHVSTHLERSRKKGDVAVIGEKGRQIGNARMRARERAGERERECERKR